MVRWSDWDIEWIPSSLIYLFISSFIYLLLTKYSTSLATINSDLRDFNGRKNSILEDDKYNDNNNILQRN